MNKTQLEEERHLLRIRRINILGVGISAVNLEQTVELLASWIAMRLPRHIIPCTVYNVTLCQQDTDYRTIVNRADLVTPDGMPLVFIAWLMGHNHVDRVYGPDLMLALCKRSVELGYTHYFYGGQEEVASRLADALTNRFPGLRVMGTYAPPFRALSDEENESHMKMINDAHPDIVWVGLGSPKQEQWIAAHRSELRAPLLIGVGAAFDFHSGRLPQAPRWMQRTALEWLFRLLVEPRRLWRRYLIHNPVFLILIVLQALRIKRFTLD